MSIFRKMRAAFHDDWCKECTEVMDVVKKQLYMLPQSVGNYISHTNAEYYKKNLIKIEKSRKFPQAVMLAEYMFTGAPNAAAEW